MTTTFAPVVPTIRVPPTQIAKDTFVLHSVQPALGEPLFVYLNSMVILGAEPMIVDAGTIANRDQWLDDVFSLVEPEDVRWIFLSHDDGDHTGALLDVLEMCPRATFVTNFFSVERLALEKPALPLERMRWVDEGGSFDAGDRTLHLFKPPIFDGPTTRGLYDPTTAAMWVVDSFACPVPGAILDVHDLDRDYVAATVPAMNSLVSPWHQWLDPEVYRRHVDDVESLGVLAVASAHGPVLTGDAIHEAFDTARSIAGQPIIPGPGQPFLDDLLAGLLVTT